MPRSRHELTPEMDAPARLSYTRPKGAQLREILTGLAASLGTGALLPSERALAENYGVARMTVRQVIDSMVTEGVLYRRHGQGTFVAAPKLVQSETLTSFTKDMRARGLTPGARVVSVTIRPTPEEIAEPFGLPVGLLAIDVIRIRTADGIPIALESASFPAERFGGLESIDLTDASIWDILEQRWGVRLGAAQRRISAVLPTVAEAGQLEIERRQPCFAIEGITHDVTGAVMEWGRSLYRGDRYDVVLHARHGT